MTKLFVLFITLGVFVSNAWAEEPHYTVGTGSKGATYYPVGKAICELVTEKKIGFSCEAVSTGGSVYNLKSIQNGTHQLGISQATMQYASSKGVDTFASEGANEKLRTVIPLHIETMILAVKKDSGITSFSDLKGKRVNIGNVGSGTRVILEDLLAHKSVTNDFELTGYKSSELPEKFCDGSIDAAIYSTGHPNRIYREMIANCDVVLLDLWDVDIAAFLEKNPQFVKVTLPANIYEGHANALTGFGIPTVLSASSDVPAEHVKQLLKVVTENRKELEAQHPVFQTISFTPLKTDRLAPYHAGTKAFFGME